MSAVGQVEGFIDQWKIRNDVIDDGMLDHRPVLPRRIVRMTSPNHAAATGFQRKKYPAAPPLGHSETKGALGGNGKFHVMQTVRQLPEYALHETCGFSGFIESH